MTLLRPLLLQEYIEKLRWVDKFVRDEVEPLDQLNFSPCEPRYSRQYCVSRRPARCGCSALTPRRVPRR